MPKTSRPACATPGLRPRSLPAASLGKDPEIVDQLSQGLLQVGLTNFVMINEVDDTILGFLAPYMFDDMDHFFRATQDTQSELMDGIRASMQAQGIRIAGLPGLGGTMGVFNAKNPDHPRSRTWRTCGCGPSTPRRSSFSSNGACRASSWTCRSFRAPCSRASSTAISTRPVVALIFRHTEFLKHYTRPRRGHPVPLGPDVGRLV